MNKKRIFGFLGFLYLASGTFFVLNGFSSITGNVVINEITSSTSSFFGVAFVFIGLFLMAASTREMEMQKSGNLELFLNQTSTQDFSSLISTGRIKYHPPDFEILEPAPILLDTSFIRDMQKRKTGFPENYFKGYKVWINEQTNAELRNHGHGTNIAKGVGNTNSILAHLEKFNPEKNHKVLSSRDYQAEERRLNLTHQDTEYIKDEIYGIWLKTKKGTLSSEHEKIKFAEGAEFEYLYYGVLRGEKPTFILSIDKDVKDVASVLNTKGINIKERNLRSKIYGISYNEIFKGQ